MIIPKNFILLSFFVLFTSSILPSEPGSAENSSEQDHSGQNKNKEEWEKDLLKARIEYINHKKEAKFKDQSFQESIHSWDHYGKQALLTGTIQYGFKWADRGIEKLVDYAAEKITGEESPEKKLQKELADLKKTTEIEAAKEKSAEASLKNALALTRTAEKDLLESQKLNQDIQSACLLCERMPGGFNNPECIKKLKEHAHKLGMKLP